MSGNGSYTYSSGDTYEGEFKHGTMTGVGELTTVDGSVYRGHFQHGLFDGHGSYQFANGDSYEGEFRLGRYHGAGNFVRSVHSIYTGNFESGLFVGRGTLVHETGSRYEGRFKNSQFHGHGKFTNTEGEVYVGEFVDGKFTGTGIYKNKRGDIYSGEFRNWIFHGRGEFSLASGVTLSGNFEDGKLNGPGHMQSSYGQFDGDFENGKMNGNGVLIRANGDEYSGEFKNNRFHGRGRMIYAEPQNGVREWVGEWQYGEFLENIEAERKATHESVEQALYSQQSLLENALKTIEGTEPNQMNMYFVGIAGYGDQDVFMKEIQYIKQQFDRNFDTAGRSVVLINNPQTLTQIPMATTTSIEKALKTVADKMDPEKDILFLYLSSHGSKDHQLSIQQKGLDLADLPAKRLGSIISALPVKWKIIGVSACYSGGFIPQLKNESTMIMTAASNDKQSFGCSENHEMTYFGRAFFREAIPQTHSFAEAFKKARKLIFEWEEQHDYHSDPQLHAPRPILAHLRKWRRQLGTKPSMALATDALD